MIIWTCPKDIQLKNWLEKNQDFSNFFLVMIKKTFLNFFEMIC